MALAGKVCLVTGASRGIGKGIALQLGKAGATVYITGRSSAKATSHAGGTLKETADEIDSVGGKAIPVVCDHGEDEQIKDLFEKIKSDSGRIDILVNNAYAAVNFIMEEMSAKRKFWEHEGGPARSWDVVNRVGLRNHYICSAYAAQMMVEQGQGLIVNISSPGGLRYLFNVSYGVGKAALDRMAADMAVELKSRNVTYVSLWPGAVLTENIVAEIADAKAKGETERAANLDRIFGQGETIEYSGMAVVSLAKDPNVISKTGRVLIAADLGHEYGFKDIGGVTRSSLRQVNYLARASGWTTLASIIPDCFKIPGSIISAMASKI